MGGSFPATWNAYNDLTLSSAASTVDWYGNSYFDGDPTSFSIDFYSNNGGLPGTLLDSTMARRGLSGLRRGR